MRKSYSYYKCIYKVEQKNFGLISKSRGLYAITDRHKIYFGSAFKRTLYKRVPESCKEQKMENCTAYFFPENLFVRIKKYNIPDLITQLERHCIETLFTLKICNSAPFWLNNTQNCKFLPPIAWDKRKSHRYTLPLEISETILFDIGMPTLFRQLSCYQLQCQCVGEEIIKSAGGLAEIMRSEIYMRSTGSSYPSLKIITLT